MDAPTSDQIQTNEDARRRDEHVAHLADRAASGAFLLTARGAALRIIAFGSNAVLARLLVPRDFGVLAFGFTLIALGGFLIDSGLGASLVRSERPPDRHVLGAVLGFQLAVTALICAVMFALTAPFGRVMTLSAVMASGLLVQAPRVPPTILLERNLVYAPLALVDLLDAICYTILAIGLVVAGEGVWGVVIALVIRAIPGTVFLLSRVPAGRVLPTLSIRRLRPILSFGAQFQAISLVGFLRDEVMNVAVAAMAGFAVLGIVSLVDRLMQTLILLFESLWRVSYPAMAQLRRLEQDPRPIIDRLSTLCLTATSFLVVGLSAGLPGSLTVVFGNNWHGALYILPGALAGLLVVGPVSTACAGFLFAVGDARAVLISASTHTLIAWLMLPLYFLLGLAAFGLAAVVVCLIEAVMLARATARWLGPNPLLRLMAPCVLALVISAAAWLAALRLPHGLFTSCILALVAEAILFVTLSLTQRSALVDFAAITSRYMSRFAPVRLRGTFRATT